MTDPEFTRFRINARIDRIAEEQLRYVTEHTQMNVTEALRASIALMYDKVSREHACPAEILKRSENFLAMGDSGRADGSENYKSDLDRAYASKLTIGSLDADR